MDPSFSPSSELEIATPRMRFFCRVHGDSDGVPMLLLHSSHATSRWWEPFFDILPDAIHAVAPDLRGCGKSDKSAAGPTSYSIAEQSEDIWSLVQALGWSDIDLVGHSSGGAIAIEYALNHQESLHTLSLVDSVPIEGVFTPVEVFRLLDQMQTDRSLLAQALAAMMPTFDIDGEIRTANRELFSRFVEDALAMAPEAFTATAAALSHWNRFRDAGRLTLPTLLVWGELDQIVDRDVTTRTLIAIPGAHNLEVLRGVGHSPMVEAPIALAERLIDFITEDYDEFDLIRSAAGDGE
jgi:branched-chain amino acid transport system permease protein